jgi:hypothetical protein
LNAYQGDGAFLGDGQFPAGSEECLQLVVFTGLGFQHREYAECYGHSIVPFSESAIAGRSARVHYWRRQPRVSYLFPVG